MNKLLVNITGDLRNFSHISDNHLTLAINHNFYINIHFNVFNIFRPNYMQLSVIVIILSGFNNYI